MNSPKINVFYGDFLSIYFDCRSIILTILVGYRKGAIQKIKCFRETAPIIPILPIGGAEEGSYAPSRVITFLDERGVGWAPFTEDLGISEEDFSYLCVRIG